MEFFASGRHIPQASNLRLIDITSLLPPEGCMKVLTAAVAGLCFAAGALGAQTKDPDKTVADGGVKMAGWTGRIDPQAAKAGKTISETKFVGMGPGFHVTSGPAAIYWNPANTAKGNYTVTSTFTQTKAATHPEGYGIVIAGRSEERR